MTLISRPQTNYLHSNSYQCLFCDGFEQRDYPIDMLTFPNASYNHLALTALHFNPDTTMFSNGPMSTNSDVQEAFMIAQARGAKLDTRPIERLINNGAGPGNGITIEFKDGTSIKLGMLLHRPATGNVAQHLIEQPGLAISETGGDIGIEGIFGESSVPGCFAAGDTQDLMKQVATAMGTD